MKYSDSKTIYLLSKQSDSVVIGLTILYAMGGAALTIPQGPGIWAMWIPLCFTTIPPIHYLCRKVQDLTLRLDEMEKKLSYNKSGKADS